MSLRSCDPVHTRAVGGGRQGPLTPSPSIPCHTPGCRDSSWSLGPVTGGSRDRPSVLGVDVSPSVTGGSRGRPSARGVDVSPSEPPRVPIRHKHRAPVVCVYDRHDLGRFFSHRGWCPDGREGLDCTSAVVRPGRLGGDFCVTTATPLLLRCHGSSWSPPRVRR